MISVKEIKNQKEMISHYGFIKDIPFVNITPETMLARSLVGQYGIISFIEDEKPVGVVVFRNHFPELTIVGIHLKGKTKIFHDYFYGYLKDKGYVKLHALSSLPKNKFMGVTSFKYEYTAYSKEL